MEKSNPQTHIGSFVRDLPVFRTLPEADTEFLLKAASIKNHPKHTTLFLQGDRADTFYVILQGWVKLYRTSAEGEEAVIAIATRGDVFGEAAIFDRAIYPFSAETAEESQIASIPASQLKQRAKVSPALTAKIMTILADEVRTLQIENEHMALMSAPQRVGCLLLQLSSGMLGGDGTFPFPYDKALAAARLGMKPETFSRALAQLKPVGVSVKGPEIHIENFHRLAQYCCGHCSAEPQDCKGAARHGCDEAGAVCGKKTGKI